MNENNIGREIVDAAIGLHRELGPGLLETVYERVLLQEIRKRGFGADIIVESKVILELKFVERISNAHKKQLLTYLKLTGMKLGYLLNLGGT